MTAARRDLLLICVGATVSQIGSALSMLSLALHLRVHGPIVVAAVLIAGLLPVALGAPVVGALVDRWPNRRLLILAQLAQAVLSLLLISVVDRFSFVLPVLLLIGCGAAITMPAASALIPHVTGPERAHRGYSRLAAGRSTGFLVGATLSGFLVAGPGVRVSLLVDAISFVVLGAMLTAVRAERDPRTAGDTGGPGDSALAGIRLLRHDPVLLASVIGISVAVLVGVLDNIADVYLVTDTLRAGLPAFGVIAAVWDAGMIVGAWVGGRVHGVLGLTVGLPLSAVTMGVAFLFAGTAPDVVVVGAAFLGGGLSNGFGNVLWQSLVRLRSPDAVRGRVFAAASAALTTANVAGTLLAGPVVAGLGPRWSLGSAGAVTLVVGVLTLVIGYRVVARERARSIPAPVIA